MDETIVNDIAAAVYICVLIAAATIGFPFYQSLKKGN